MEYKLKKPYLVTDKHRGIYFGYFAEQSGDAIRLTRARHCYSYTSPDGADKGVYSLATVGPRPGSRIGPEVTMTISDVANVVECGPSAVKAWKAARWG